MPKKVKKRRLVTGDDGEEQGWEEYYDYHFPDDRSAPMNLKILELAHQWKQTGVLAGLADAGTSGGGEEVDEATRRDGPATKKARIGDDEEEIDIDDIGDS